MRYFWIAALLLSCRQESENLIVTPAPQDTAVIDTTYLDLRGLEHFDSLHIDTSNAVSRSTDGYFDIIILGDGYKGKDGLNLFLTDYEMGKQTLLNSFVEDFDSLTIDTSKVRFHFRNVKADLSCDDNTGLNEGVSCSVDKIRKVAKEMTNNFTLFTPDHISVFMNNKVHGGSDGALISVVGFGEHITVSWICPSFYQGAMGKLEHEFYHTYVCICHIEFPSNKLSGCVNGCCYILGSPLLPEHQIIFYNKFNQAIN